MTIEKLLIANRGEIALRIHRAAHELAVARKSKVVVPVLAALLAAGLYLLLGR